LSSWLTEQQIQTLAREFSDQRLRLMLSPDFSVQLNVSLSERLSSWLSQKVKSLSATGILDVTLLTLHSPIPHPQEKKRNLPLL